MVNGRIVNQIIMTASSQITCPCVIFTEAFIIRTRRIMLQTLVLFSVHFPHHSRQLVLYLKGSRVHSFPEAHLLFAEPSMQPLVWGPIHSPKYT